MKPSQLPSPLTGTGDMDLGQGGAVGQAALSRVTGFRGWVSHHRVQEAGGASAFWSIMSR